MTIDDGKMTSLLSTIEKVRRRKISDVGVADIVSYIDPSNYLDKLSISNNHIIQGRRGSGKTTLLLKRIEKTTNEVTINIDCQPLKNETSNSIITDIIVKTLEAMESNIPKDMLASSKKHSGIVSTVIGIFSKKTREKRLIAKQMLNIFSSTNSCLSSFTQIKEMPDEKRINRMIKNIASQATIFGEKSRSIIKSNLVGMSKANIGFDSSLEGYFKIGAMVEANQRYSSSTTSESVENSEEVLIIKKEEVLNKSKDGLAQLFNTYSKYINKKIVLYLDDFYLIRENEQVFIIRFLHDLYKLSYNSCFCFKLSVLPYRIKLNPEGNYDLSLKDDFSPIRLDHDLADFENLKNHLLSILANLNTSLEITIADIRSCYANEDAINYSIIASGGIPRDFIVLFSDLISDAKNNARDTISKVNIYNVVKELKNDKEQNIEFDSDISPEMIRESIAEISKNIVEDKKTNVFLYQRERSSEEDNILRNLINLRYIHSIKENISSENVKKIAYDAYLVDMIFYATGQRMPRDFNFREFWVKDEEQRQSQLHRSPILRFSCVNVRGIENET